MKIKQGKMRILLACADESLLKQTKRLMQASNELELVGCTSNGTKAWEMIRQKTPDMVVLDTDLPYADGLYLMTPFNRVALMERLIGRLKQEVLGAY
jgi:two-component system response regulator (stage 0 sporulation protein A)